MHRFQHVRMAEWSKAPDSRLRFASLIGGQCENSGPRMRAWVQIPLLTKTFLFWLSVHYYLSAVSSKSHEVAWPSGLRRWFKAPVSSGAWVRIPPLPKDFIFLPLNALWDASDLLLEASLPATIGSVV